MNKIWFTLINDKKEGPWAYEDLKADGQDHSRHLGLERRIRELEKNPRCP